MDVSTDGVPHIGQTPARSASDAVAEPTAAISECDYPAPLLPEDEWNRQLAAHVRPRDWVNPRPKDRYHLVVIGGGTAGLVSAAIAATLGARVALVEKSLLGGDCLNAGCVPSKALLTTARAIRMARRFPQLGLKTPTDIRVDFARVMERMRRLRAAISPHDSAARFRDLGVDVFIGAGRFIGPDRVQVEDATLRFRKAIIATGTRPAVPPLPGLQDVHYLTNETVFSLTALPRRLAVIGAGPIGCEMAQAFANFGSEVLLIEAMHGVLPREDREAGGIVQRALEHDGVRVLCCGKSLHLEKTGGGARLRVESHGRCCDQIVDALLVCAGRAPNVRGLGLEAAGVAYDEKRGVHVDDFLRTTNRRIYAAGDVCSPYKFTHAADFMARIAVRNALFRGRSQFSRLVIPWCTYTAPELAHVGLTAAAAESRGIAVDVLTQPLDEVDRAVLEEATDGFVKVVVRRGTDRILGATIVAEDAGNMIGELTMALQHGVGLKALAEVIHPYPTIAEAIRKLGDRYNRTRLTPFAKRLLRWILGRA
ncbi:MAG: FAD-containing oxidoreductase [Planctomycetota bacterium]|nr:MAG: FAD-containing oxidoreductase [Planctomycetota bacterium]